MTATARCEQSRFWLQEQHNGSCRGRAVCNDIAVPDAPGAGTRFKDPCC